MKRNSVIAGLFLTLLLALVPCAQGQTTFFIFSPTDMADFPGGTENAVYKPKKAAEVISFELGYENTVNIGSISGGGGAGRAEFGPLGINFIGEPGLVPKLFEKLVTGEHYGELVIEEVANGEVVGRTSMKLCMISNLRMTGVQGDRAVYTAEIQYGAVKIETFKLKPDGSTEAAGEFSWSRVLNNNTYSVVP
ncbi:MAG: type VI secretion system tube protein Hcp [Akkermansiaceae bacterium]|jgi:type VI secretion system secreted protein Hcp|nr:type VI secretion system tube protein Hcp [Akkermansiaceae bacterium]